MYNRYKYKIINIGGIFMNDTLKNLKERRSVKKYKDTLISKELLNEILEAGTYAANGRGAHRQVL